MVSKVDQEFSDFVHVIEHYVCSIYMYVHLL